MVNTMKEISAPGSFPALSPFRRLVMVIFVFSSMLCGLYGCRTLVPGIMDGSALERIDSGDYPEFGDDMSYDGLEHSIRMSLSYLEKLPRDRMFQFGEDAYDCRHMIRSLEYFLRFLKTRPTRKELNIFIASRYLVYQSIANDDENGVLFTGYYEPLLKGSFGETPEFPVPVFSLPEDIAFIDLSLFDLSLPADKKLVGRITDDHRVVPYYQRREITRSNLNGKSVPLAWVGDRVDLFFLEIQGSGKIYMDEETYINVHYHATNGHPYKSIGSLLIREKKIPKEEMSMQKIREYLRNHPEEIDDILNYNPSYVFFKTEEDGPFGCLGVKVTPGRSIALQRKIFPAAALGFMESRKPVVDGDMNIQEWVDFQRFVMNQDTGGAIKGAGRADLFWGNGAYAEIAAGYMQHPGRLFFIVLKPDDSERQ
ncbi:MAG: murein transglycosylase [Desulfobacteraceae bacterium]|nr:MAG: murein transglycosylase [Desulfobacteraceae bacterium]